VTASSNAVACCLLLAACSSNESYPVAIGSPPDTEITRKDSGTSVVPPTGGVDASVDGSSLADSRVEAAMDASSDVAPDSNGLDSPTEADSASVVDVAVTPPSDATMPNPVCDPAANWSDPVAVEGLAFDSQPIVTMTSDELTVAWVLQANDGTGQVFVADRPDASAAFGAASELQAAGSSTSDAGAVEAGSSDGGSVQAAAATYFAFERVALSSDGLTLIGVSVQATSMAEFTRTARGQAFFAYPQPSNLAPLSRGLYPGEQLGDPVLSPDGNDIVYSRYGLDPTVSVYEAFRSGPVAWGAGSPKEGQDLLMTAGGRKRPLSLSADRLTLFVWDEATNATLGLFRADPMGDFGSAQSFGEKPSLQVSASCMRMYYVAPTASGYGLVQTTSM
jgi:hypothetical protein